MCEDSDTNPTTLFLSYINYTENIRLQVQDGELFTLISPYGEKNATYFNVHKNVQLTQRIFIR